MTVIASDPEVHPVPPSIPLSVGANFSDSVINDPHCVDDDWCVVTFGVRSLVDSSESNEGESHALSAQSASCFLSHLTVDREPTAHVAPKVRRGRTRDERRALTDALATSKTSPDNAQRANARLGELEDCRRSAIDVAIHKSHLRAYIASRMSRKSRDAMRTVVPPQPGQADAPGISSHQERSVGGTSHRGKCRGNGRELSFMAQCGEPRQLTAIDGESENIRSHSIGYYHHDLRTIT